MKINQLKTALIVCTLLFDTAVVSLRCIFNYYFSKPSRLWTDKTLNHWVDQLLKGVQVEYTVVNPFNIEPEQGKATILMCNHSSSYDIPLAFKAFPKHSIRMLSKKELSKVPLMGKAMQASEFPFIDRKNRYQAIKDLQYAKKLMESGILLWVAPEGTRSKDGRLAPFKKGAFVTAIQAEAIIIPIGIKGAHNILPAGTFNINLNQKAEIHIGKPINAAEYTLENKAELMTKTYNVIKKLIE